ncbi:MAG TPA: hypothetical protein VFM56_15385 [Solimonas sp.]|nr:hypothetical protein [Solimonas sp.]
MKRPLLALSLLAVSAIAAAHDDDWCADAVDFSMGAAQNREIGYPLDIVVSSLDRNPGYYQRMFESLSVADMKQLTTRVYAQRWTRFQAALSVTESCEPQ